MESVFVKNKNIKLLINYGVGPVLFVWFSVSIYHQLQSQPHLQDAIQALRRSLTGPQAWKFYLTLLLVPVNWGIEARKWQVLLKPLERISVLLSFRAVLAGLAFSMNTPNRVGEYGGRVAFVQDGHRWKALSLTIIGSFSQVLVTLLMGMGGLFFLSANPVAAQFAEQYNVWIKVLLWGSTLVTVVLALLYLNLSRLVGWIEHIPRAERLLSHIRIIEDLPVTILLRTISLSFIRYLIFVFQYILLLQVFGIEAGVWHCFWLISVLYLVLAITPTIALAELGLRGQVSLMLFGLVSSNSFGIVGAASGIWLLNLVLPSLAGSLFFVGLKIFSDK